MANMRLDQLPENLEEWMDDAAQRKYCHSKPSFKNSSKSKHCDNHSYDNSLGEQKRSSSIEAEDKQSARRLKRVIHSDRIDDF